jgi:hypothetical protein
MRDDMHEVVIERPRWGSRMRHARRLRRVDPKRTSVHDPESLPFRIGHRRAATLNRRTKEFSDLLAPLKRYLMRQVNRPWDKIWSEICKNLKVDNPAQRHVRLHVHDFVAINTFVRDGAVWVAGRWGRAAPLTDGHDELYVDPRTGILRRNKFYKRYPQRRRESAAAEARERAHRMREISADVQVHLLRDSWWEIRLAPIRTERLTVAGRTDVYYVPYRDVLIGTSLTKLTPRELYGREGVYAVSKRQLKSAEIARLGLRA